MVANDRRKNVSSSIMLPLPSRNDDLTDDLRQLVLERRTTLSRVSVHHPNMQKVNCQTGNC
ncbi:hypothetical protein BDP81DRAFT_428250, partial [Colletotrichum phormii]